ncbi:MAG: Hpt domain-containing protein [Acidobacteriota bacterium]
MDSTQKGAEPEQTAAIAAALDRMWVKFLPHLRERARVLGAAAQAAAEGRLSEDLRRQALEAAHKLAGSLGTFGLERGTEWARTLETLYAESRVKPGDAAALAEAAAAIRSAIEGRKTV